MENQISFEGYPALAVANDKIEAVTLIQGASLVSLTLHEDPSRLNPLWNPQQIARDHGDEFSRVFAKNPGFGHFVCVDGFGPGSPEEQKAGLPMHGEAHQQLYEIQRCSKDDHVLTVTLSAALPLVQEKFTRTLHLVDGENVLYLESQLENLLAFDRPVSWAEHATIGASFLERGKTVVDMPAAYARTRDYQRGEPGHRLAPFREFTWPFAPRINGALVDLRAAGHQASGDHTTCLMPRDRCHAFITFLHPEKQKMLGYVFRPNEFPWVQNWEYYPANGQLARGLEFSTQPYDAPRREAIQTNSMFGTLTYRWLPAKSTIASKFLMFWTGTPTGFTKIDDVRIENGVITVSDISGHTFAVAASLGL
ncbi:MAG: hypothetical protein WCF68_19435 [Terriglobales bacterium]